MRLLTTLPGDFWKKLLNSGSSPTIFEIVAAHRLRVLRRTFKRDHSMAYKNTLGLSRHSGDHSHSNSATISHQTIDSCCRTFNFLSMKAVRPSPSQTVGVARKVWQFSLFTPT